MRSQVRILLGVPMKLLLALLAAFVGWRYMIRPWLTAKRRDRRSGDRNFRGQVVREADFEEIVSKEEEREHP